MTQSRRLAKKRMEEGIFLGLIETIELFSSGDNRVEDVTMVR